MAVKKRALVSVSDKRFVTNLARDLVKLGFELVSTGGTYKKLKEAKIPCKELSRLIKSPELVGGRVKTLHPHVHAAILAERDVPEHIKDLEREGIQPFDLVVVNFYPFTDKVKPGMAPASAVEWIDIGGPTMVRAAAKNFKHVGVVTNIEQYREVLHHLREHGTLLPEFRMQLARDAFIMVAQYDAAVAKYFEETAPASAQVAEAPKKHADILPAQMTLALKMTEKLRYGENPHQQAARYNVSGLPSVHFKVLQGKEMSYNNYLDAGAALSIVSAEYPRPVVACVVKHLNPCGIAVGENPVKVFIQAREADPTSAFGGIVGLNCKVDSALAAELKKTFFEIVVAPSFEPAARELLAAKINLRLIQADPLECREARLHAPRMNAMPFGILMEGQDITQETWEQLQVVTNIVPPEKLKEDILLGLTYIRFLKSNSLCVVKDSVMVGAGMGQTSRVKATEIALEAADKRAVGAVLVSDGFFPFSDSIELAAKAKIACVVAPAGSKRDMEVVAAANKLKLPLIFAPLRHFLH
jgi:phosphoribosylaminoimidazolecarboxamide formyltransferase / IMP cyclohydrolase